MNVEQQVNTKYLVQNVLWSTTFFLAAFAKEKTYTFKVITSAWTSESVGAAATCFNAAIFLAK